MKRRKFLTTACPSVIGDPVACTTRRPITRLPGVAPRFPASNTTGYSQSMRNHASSITPPTTFPPMAIPAKLHGDPADDQHRRTDQQIDQISARPQHRPGHPQADLDALGQLHRLQGVEFFSFRHVPVSPLKLTCNPGR